MPKKVECWVASSTDSIRDFVMTMFEDAEVNGESRGFFHGVEIFVTKDDDIESVMARYRREVITE